MHPGNDLLQSTLAHREGHRVPTPWADRLNGFGLLTLDGNYHWLWFFTHAKEGQDPGPIVRLEENIVHG